VLVVLVREVLTVVEWVEWMELGPIVEVGGKEGAAGDVEYGIGLVN
jgi:hypothetical protein